MNCNPDALATMGKQFGGLPESAKLNILVYLFARMANVTPIDPSVLAYDARCFCGLQDDQKWNILLYLSCLLSGTVVCITGGVGPPAISVPCDFSAYIEQPGPNFGFWLGDIVTGWSNVIAQGP